MSVRKEEGLGVRLGSVRKRESLVWGHWVEEATGWYGVRNGNEEGRQEI